MNAIYSFAAKTALTVLALFAPLAASAEDVYFPNDATINYRIAGAAVLGYANEDDYYNFENPTRPNVTFEDGAFLDDRYGDLFAGGGSFLTMTGGWVSNDLVVDESSSANISGGTVGRFLSVGGDYYGFGRPIVNISGVSVGYGVFQNGDSIVNFSGGTFGTEADLGVSVTEGIFNMSGGTVVGDLNTYYGAVNLSGGSVGNVVVGDGIGNITGGNISGYIAVTRTGTLTVYGSGLNLTLIDPEFYDGSISLYALNGWLQDGTPLVNKEVWVGNIMGSQFRLVNAPTVPEPNALIFGMAALGGCIALRRKSRAR